jgi:F-type H+-transporting ATPase subunit delta
MISIRYARALFDFSHEKGVEGTVYEEMKRLASCFGIENSLRTQLDNPTLTAADKKVIILARLGTESSEVMRSFIDLVLQRKREFYLQFICRSFLHLYRQSKGIETVTLKTAVPLGSDHRFVRNLTGLKLPGKQLDIHTVVDASLIGGFQIFVDTYCLDASVSSQLHRVRREMLENNRLED